MPSPDVRQIILKKPWWRGFVCALVAVLGALSFVIPTNSNRSQVRTESAESKRNEKRISTSFLKSFPLQPPLFNSINVNSTAQSPGTVGDCTLGEAIQAANTNAAVDGCSAGSSAGADTIILPAGTYTLTTIALADTYIGNVGLPGITTDVVIQGAGSGTTIIERSAAAINQFRLMAVSNQNGGSIVLNDLTMRGGRTAGQGPVANQGGALYTFGRRATLNRVVFNDNRGARGGAVTTSDQGGILIANDCVFTNNQATGEGGAIVSGQMTVARSTFTGNSAVYGGALYFIQGGVANFNISDSTFTNNQTVSGGFGGAIRFSGAATIARSEFTSNSAGGSSGGAIYGDAVTLNLIDSVVNGNQASSGGGLYLSNCSFNISRSTISNNIASTHFGGGIYLNTGGGTVSASTINENSTGIDGGGVWASSTNVSVVNSTISGNTSAQYGGGVYVQGFSAVTLALNNTTISENHAGSQGGGILRFHQIVNVTAANSLVASNTAAINSPDIYAPTSFTSLGYNLIGIKDGANFTNATGDQTGTAASPINPQLGPLQNNGGTTFTRALLSNSPALDAANPSTPGSGGNACAGADQRGVGRPRDGNSDSIAICDIGAHETMGTVVCATPPSGMTAWWPFDGNANDIQGNNPATLLGNPAFNTGEVDQGLSFDGNDDYVITPANAALDIGSGSGMTFDAWIKPAEVATARPLIEWNSGIGPHLWMSADFAEGGQGQGSLFVNLVDTGGVYHIFSSPPGLLVGNQWQHVAVTYDKTSGVAKIYLNGTIVAQQTLGIFTPQTGVDLYLGYRPTGVLGGRRYLGDIDEVELFDRALDSTEIKSIYFADVAGKCKPAPTPTPTPFSCIDGHVSWFRGENNALDASGTNNGTLRNGAAFAAGEVNQGFSLDGVNDYIEVPDNPTLNPGTASFTIDAWVKSTFKSGYQPIVTKYECGGVCPANATSYYALYIFDGMLQGSLRDTKNNLQTLTGINIIADGSFHHVAMVRDVAGGELRIYVDGVVAANAPLMVTGSIKDDDGEADPFNIGFQKPPDLNLAQAFYFTGIIDELDYFSRALSTTEIAEVFSAGSSGKCSSIPPPAVINVNEQITVNDTPSLLSAKMIGINENISVHDIASLLQSALVSVNESIAVNDKPLLPVFIAVNENVLIRDLPALLPSAMISINESIVVNDRPALFPPLVIAVNENVLIRDVPALLPSAMIGINESIVVNDRPALFPPAVIAVNENILIRDLPALLPSAMIGINERIFVNDRPALFPPVVIAVNENVLIRDIPALRPAAMIGINESIVVNDRPALFPPVVIAVTENVLIRDLPSLRPSVLIGINENISVSDRPTLFPPVLIAVHENISVSELPGMLPSALIGINENVSVSARPTLLLPVLIAVNENVSVRDLPAMLSSALIGINENISVNDRPTLLVPVLIAVNENISLRDIPSSLPSAMIRLSEHLNLRDAVGLIPTPIFVSLPTPTGTNVTINSGAVTLTFPNVTFAGTTTITPIDPTSTGQLPVGYQLPGTSFAFDITTTAQYSGLITLCFSVPSVTDHAGFADLRVLHNENGTLVDRTTSHDFATRTICATVSSLSPFVVAQVMTGPRPLLQATLNDLKTSRDAISAPRDRQKLDEIIKQLGDALDPGNWRDYSHPLPNRGDKVFDKIEGAVQKLTELSVETKSTVAPALLQAFIRNLLQSARMVAQTALIDASSANGNPTEILKANEELLRGDTKVARGKYVQAVADYREVWIHALSAGQ